MFWIAGVKISSWTYLDNTHTSREAIATLQVAFTASVSLSVLLFSSYNQLVTGLIEF